MTSHSSAAAPAHRDPGRGLTEQVVSLPDGRAVRCVVGGTAGPQVVFECGLGAPAAEWVAVQRLLSQSCRTLAYDRAGFGGSDPDPEPRTLERITADLDAVLTAAEIDEPAVFVGHSWGGPILRLLARTAPHRLAGAVLIDASVVAALGPSTLRMLAVSYGVTAGLARVGGVRARLLRALTRGWKEMSADDVEIVGADYLTPANVATARRELRGVTAALPLLGELEAQGLPVPTLHVVAATGSGRLRPVMIAEARRLAQRDRDGRCVVVERAGHLIPQERPGRTAEEVLGHVRAVTRP